MDLTKIRSQARKYTRTNSTNYPTADLDADINVAYGEVHEMILEAEGDDNSGGNFKVIDFTSTTGLTEQDLGYNGEYPFPDGASKIKEVHVKYSADTDYVQAEIIETNEMGSEMFEDTGIYSQYKPKVFIFRNSYFIRPLLTETTVADGIKLLVIQDQEDLVVATDEPYFRKNFHDLIPLKVALDYAMVHPEKYNPRIERKVNELESQIISAYEDDAPKTKIFKPVREKFNGTFRGNSIL